MNKVKTAIESTENRLDEAGKEFVNFKTSFKSNQRRKKSKKSKESLDLEENPNYICFVELFKGEERKRKGQKAYFKK